MEFDFDAAAADVDPDTRKVEDRSRADDGA